MKYICLPLLIFLILSCNGQNNNQLSKQESKVEPTIPLQTKLVKTQGTNEYANVHCALQDKSGKLWFGTTGEGVYCYDGSSFRQYTVSDGLSHNYVWCMMEDKDGNIWFGTADGACIYNGKNFITIPITQIKNNTDYQKTVLDDYKVPYPQENSVWKILQDRNGKIWFGTTDGIYCYDGKSYSHFLHNDGAANNTGVPVAMVEAMVEDKAGNIWFAGRGTEGVFRWDGKSLTHFKPDAERWMWPMLQDKEGNIWFSNFSGVCRYEGTSFHNYRRKDDSSLTNVTCIIQDKKGNIWFGSDDSGICCYNGKTFKNYSAADGLDNYRVFCMIEDNKGNIWVGTRNTSLYRFNGKTFTKFSE